MNTRIFAAAKPLLSTIAFIVFLIFYNASSVFADTITIDEKGNGIGTMGSGFFANDPGPGGLSNILTYRLPFAGFQGDVLLTDAGLILDVLRFNGDGTVKFYSDNLDGLDDPGDTLGPPGLFYANRVIVAELGSEGNSGAFYTPLPGQPGYNAANNPTYHFISDGSALAVPEPATIVLLGFGLAALGLRARKGA